MWPPMKTQIAAGRAICCDLLQIAQTLIFAIGFDHYCKSPVYKKKSWTTRLNR
jgi:hypothetical protein